jgi:mannosyl-3-phosphoglycerate phosphatase
MKAPHVLLIADVDQSVLKATSARDAADAKALLAGDATSLVLCSNMTRAELEMCQQELDIHDPFICESGAAVLLPSGYFPFDVPADRDLTGHHAIEYGSTYADVVNTIRRATSRIDVPVVGFSDLSVEQVATDSGLSLSQARLAKLREYDEPIRILDPAARPRLFKAFHSAGLACTYRGTYDHIGAAVDKSQCVRLLTTLYKRARGPLLTIGVGDATNSARLLSHVKLPFVIESGRQPENRRLLPQIPRLNVEPGSPRWLDAIVAIIEQARGRWTSVRRAPSPG